mgnify:CR=1 FL=1
MEPPAEQASAYTFHEELLEPIARIDPAVCGKTHHYDDNLTAENANLVGDDGVRLSDFNASVSKHCSQPDGLAETHIWRGEALEGS